MNGIAAKLTIRAAVLTQSRAPVLRASEPPEPRHRWERNRRYREVRTRPKARLRRPAPYCSHWPPSRMASSRPGRPASGIFRAAHRRRWSLFWRVRPDREKRNGPVAARYGGPLRREVVSTARSSSHRRDCGYRRAHVSRRAAWHLLWDCVQSGHERPFSVCPARREMAERGALRGAGQEREVSEAGEASYCDAFGAT
jgi:hypothetical protein